MTVYVLTQVEKRQSIPVGVSTDPKIAKDWVSASSGNDYYELAVDNLEHLGIPNGPSYIERGPTIGEKLGWPPESPGGFKSRPGSTQAERVQQICDYVLKVSKYTEKCAAYMREVARFEIEPAVSPERVKRQGNSASHKGTDQRVAPRRGARGSRD